MKLDPLHLWIVGGVVAAAVLIIAVAIWAFRGRRRSARIDEPEDAIREAEATVPNFSAESAVVGIDGRAALVVDGRGRVVAAKVLGPRIIAREITWQKVRAVPGGMEIDSEDRRFGSVLVAGVNALHIRKLAPQLTQA